MTLSTSLPSALHVSSSLSMNSARTFQTCVASSMGRCQSITRSSVHSILGRAATSPTMSVLDNLTRLCCDCHFLERAFNCRDSSSRSSSDRALDPDTDDAWESGLSGGDRGSEAGPSDSELELRWRFIDDADATGSASSFHRVVTPPEQDLHSHDFAQQSQQRCR